MRVLLTTDTVGGVWTYTQELTEGLIEYGCSVILVSFGRLPSETQFQWSLRVSKEANNRFYFIPSEIPLEWMPNNSTIVDEGASLLHSIIRDLKPDLLHSNQFCFGRLSLAIPKLLVAHSDVLSWAEACVPGGLEPSSWLSRYVDMVQKGLQGADALVAPTFDMLSALKRNFVLPFSQSVISNGRSVKESDCPVERLLQAVTAGRLWDPSKNLSVIEQIKDFPVMIAGDVDGQPMLLPRNSTLRYLGFLPESELHCLFRQSHIYIAASIYEPFGLAPLEAALCGCALVANDVPSFREVWGSAALYFRTLPQLQRLLERLSSDGGLLADMQSHTLARARRYTAKTMTLKYLAAYTKLISCFPTQPDQTASLLPHVL